MNNLINKKFILKVIGYESLNNISSILFSICVMRLTSVNNYADILILYSWVAIIESIIRPRQENNFIRSKNQSENKGNDVTIFLNSTYISILLVILLFIATNYVIKINQINYVIIFVVINLILTNSSYIYNIIGEHKKAIKIQVIWNLTSLITIGLYYNIKDTIDLNAIIVARIIGLIITAIFAKKIIIMIILSLFSSSPVNKITIFYKNFNKNIYLTNVFSGLSVSSPLYIIDLLMGRVYIGSIGLTKQISEIIFRFIPSSITPYIIDKYSKSNHKIMLVRHKNFLKYLILIGVAVISLITLLLPIAYFILNKSFNSNYFDHFIIILISFFTILSNFIGVFYIARFQEKIFIKTYFKFSVYFLFGILLIYLLNYEKYTHIFLSISSLMLLIFIYKNFRNDKNI